MADEPIEPDVPLRPDVIPLAGSEANPASALGTGNEDLAAAGAGLLRGATSIPVGAVGFANAATEKLTGNTLFPKGIETAFSSDTLIPAAEEAWKEVTGGERLGSRKDIFDATKQKLNELHDKSAAASTVGEFTGFGAGAALGGPLGLAGNTALGVSAGSGGYIDESILGDHEAAAEKVLIAGGITGAIGAGTSAFLSGVSHVAESEIAQSLKDRIGKAADKLSKGITGEGHVDLANDLRGIQNGTDSLFDKFEGEGQIRHREADAMLAKHDIQPVAGRVNEYLGAAAQDIKQAAVDETLSPKLLRTVYDIHNDAVDAVTGAINGGEDGASLAVRDALYDAKKRLASLAAKYKPRGQVILPEQQETYQSLNEISRSYKDSLRDPKVFGDYAHRHAEIDGVAERLINTEEYMNKKIGSKAPDIDNNGRIGLQVNDDRVRSLVNGIVSGGKGLEESGMDQYFAAANDYAEQVKKSAGNIPKADTIENDIASIIKKANADKQAAKTSAALGQTPIIGPLVTKGAVAIRALAQVAKLKATVDAAIKKGIDAALSPGGKTFISTGFAGLKGMDLGGGKPKDTSSDQAMVEHHARALQTLAQNPDFDRLATKTSTLIQAAPMIGSMMQGKAMNAAKVMAQAVPPIPGAGDPLNPPGKMNPDDIRQFVNTAKVVHDPVSLLHRVAAGTLTQKDVATAKQVYPKLMSEIGLKLADRLPERLDILPAARRNQIGQLMGLPPSQIYRNIGLFQAGYSAPNPQPKPRAGTPKNLDKNMMSSVESAKASMADR